MRAVRAADESDPKIGRDMDSGWALDFCDETLKCDMTKCERILSSFHIAIRAVYHNKRSSLYKPFPMSRNGLVSAK